MVIPLETGAFQAALKSINTKPEVIDEIVGLLTKTSDGLSDGGFATDAQVPVAQFGDRPSARQFGSHYEKAHEVMQATIDGMAQDLMSFASNAKTAITYVKEADDDSAVDLSQAQQAVENLDEINRNSQADTNYDRGRNGAGAGS